MMKGQSGVSEFFFTFVLFVGFSFGLDAQDSLVMKWHKQGDTWAGLYNFSIEGLSGFDLVRLDIDQFYQDARNGLNRKLTIPLSSDENISVFIQERPVKTANYRVRTSSGEVIESCPMPTKTYKGHVVGHHGQKVSITVGQGFFQAYMNFSGHEIFWEQANRHDKNVDEDLLVVYSARDVLPVENGCGLTHAHRLQLREKEISGLSRKNSSCLEVELAVAADYALFDEQGGTAGTENEILSILNNVQTNYDNEFDDELRFELVTLFISDCSSCDPWTNSTDPSALLNDFTSWASDGGFGVNHDMGALWSNRDFSGSTIGLAWLGTVCTNFQYHILEHFTSLSGSLRSLWAHEMGHNWDAVHDEEGSNTIMAPSLTVTNNWSSLSIDDISNYYSDAQCLSECSDLVVPTADFSVQFQQICEEGSTQFFDLSTDSPSSWSWSFPGGNPSTSSEQHPSVVYDNPGSYSVILTVSNTEGSSQEVKTSYITVGAEGSDLLEYIDFESGLEDWAVVNPDNQETWNVVNIGGAEYGFSALSVRNFEYNSPGATDILQSPIMDASGVEEVYLELEYSYARYSAQFSDNLSIEVSADGGTSFTEVFFGEENGSGNFATVGDRNDEFIPGIPADWCGFSDPQCLGIDLSEFVSNEMQVRIININGHGNNMYVDNVMLRTSCKPTSPPLAGFSSSNPIGCVPFSVQYNDESSGVITSREWFFEGGTPETSSDLNPVVVYEEPGFYDVTLTVSNGAGEDMVSSVNYVVIDDQPVADFDASPEGFTVQFQNNSQRADVYEWSFGDGNTSNEENPTHTYSQDGMYLVTLTVSNLCGVAEFQDFLLISTPPEAGFSFAPTQGCFPLTVQFENESSSNVVDYHWTFEGGNPSSSTLLNPVVVYEGIGVFDVKLVVSNEAGTDSVINIDAVEVSGPPSVIFESNVDGLTVSFVTNSEGVEQFLWDFGDGSISQLESPSHTYAVDGLYEVNLMVSNECGTTTVSNTLNLSNLPKASFQSDLRSICLGDVVQFLSTSSQNVESVLWRFEGGTPETSTEFEPEVVYDQSGAFDVSLEVSNSNGSDTVIAMQYIIVDQLPGADFEFERLGLNVLFSNTSIGANSYSWIFGDGNSSAQVNPEHVYEAPGDYEVVLIASSECGADTSREWISIPDIPEANFDYYSLSGQNCAPALIQFEDASTENVLEWQWTFEGGLPSSSAEPNVTVEYVEPGSYDVTLIVSSVNQLDTIVIIDAVTIESAPVAYFQTINDGLTIHFEAEDQTASNYFWDFGDGFTSLEMNPSHIYQAHGDYPVCLVIQNNCGNDTVCQVVSTAVPPAAAVSFVQDTICAPATVQYVDMSQGAPTSWLWTCEGGNPSTSTDQNPIVVYDLPGLYGVSLVVGNAQGFDTLTFVDTIDVQGSIEAAIDYEIAGLDVAFWAVTNDNVNIFWDLGDGTQASGDTVLHSYSTPDVYNVVATLTSDCDSLTLEERLEVVLVSNEELGELWDFVLFPNPASDLLYVRTSWSLESAEITVYDGVGRAVHNIPKLGVSSLQYSLMTAEWPSGLYIVELRQGTQVHRRPVVIHH